MKKEKKGRRSAWLNTGIVILCIAAMVMMGIWLLETDPMASCVSFAIAGAYFIISIVQHHQYMEKLVSSEIRSVGFEKEELQKNLLKDLPVPHVLTDKEGRVIWYNQCFIEMMGKKSIKKNITQNFSALYKKVFPQNGSVKQIHLVHDEKRYCVDCRSMIITEWNEQENGERQRETAGEVLAFYFFDETQVAAYREETKSRSLVAGLIYLDNVEEVFENMEEVRQSLLLALVERKILKYMQGLDVIIKKFERDKFIFVCEEKNMEKMLESKFSILDEVRATSIGNDRFITMSISVGMNGSTYLETYESARAAMDLALGRGGDQAVVRDGDTISYYGGKTQTVEKSTRVKARVKAHALREIVLNHDKVFIMGHKNPDADSIGAALGIYRLAKTFDKKAYIVMDKDCPAIEPIVSVIMKGQGEEDEDIFVTNEQALRLHDDTSMLVIIDVNIPSMTECPDLVKQEKTIVVLDHHRQTNETVKNAVVSYVEPYASSSCEMVAEILQYIPDKPKLRQIEADALYSGILVDTDNFAVKAGVRTFEAAAYLRRTGADVTRVRKMFREDREQYQLRADIINRVEIYMDEFAISTFEAGNMPGATVIGAKAANSLLDIQGIRASFVITQLADCVYLSARSIDDVNVHIIMEKLGGGGHMTVAAAQLKDATADGAKWQLKELLVSMREAGDI